MGVDAQDAPGRHILVEPAVHDRVVVDSTAVVILFVVGILPVLFALVE